MTSFKKYCKILLLICLFNFLNEKASSQTSSKNQEGYLRKLPAVPNLVGLQLRDARILLGEYGIKIGKVVGLNDSVNSGNYFIYKQHPSSHKNAESPNYIHNGQRIDVWIQKEKPIIPVRRFYRAGGNDYLDSVRIIKE